MRLSALDRCRSARAGARLTIREKLRSWLWPDEFGQPIPTYVHTRPDDFAHAETYITLAANRWGAWAGWWE